MQENKIIVYTKKLLSRYKFINFTNKNIKKKLINFSLKRNKITIRLVYLLCRPINYKININSNSLK